MNPRTAAFLAVLMLACQMQSQAEAPFATQTSLIAAFQSPPSQFRPLIITHSMPLNRDDATQWLAARRAGGAVIDVGVTPGSKSINEERWNNPTYLNDPARFQKLREAMARMKQAGQRIWIYDELGYPSGSAGGRVLDGHPEFQVEVVGCRTTPVARGKTVTITPDLGKVVACYAVPVQSGQLDLEDTVDLTPKAKAGEFSWKGADDDDWLVCLFERFQPDTWRRHNIPRRNVNILDRRAVSRFIELTHVRYASELGRQLADVDLFFTDEPQFGSAEHWSGGNAESVPMVQWCDELPVAFGEKKGYDLVEVLPALFHQAGPQTSKYRYDFYDVQSDLAAENYFGQIEEWCHQHGVASSGHMLLEESLLFHIMFSGSMMKNWARMDLPGVDLLRASPYKTMAGWERGQFPVAEDFSCKMASSVAHLTGKQGVFTESFALANKVPLRQILGVAAWQFSGGITHMSTYTIQQQLPEEDYAHFSDFAGRLAVLARRGRHVADVAVLVPEASVWACYTPPDRGRYEGYFTCNPEPLAIDRIFRETCNTLSSHQRDFDCLSEQLFQQAKVDDGCLVLAGERFRVLVLPEMRMISRTSLEKVRTFLKNGGRLAFVGSLPCQTPDHGADPQMKRDVTQLLADFPETAIHLVAEVQRRELAGWIERQVPPEVRWTGPYTVRILRRQEPVRDILLVANPSSQDASGTLTVPIAGEASVWNPETGEVRMVGSVSGRPSVSIEVPAQSARFVVVKLGEE
jgi:hypothetical protein